MNREIKFRIRLRCIKDGEMWKVGEEMILINKLFDFPNGIAYNPINTEVWEIVSVQQFTGLIDAKGVEICEGDIIKKPTGTVETINPKDVGLTSEYKVYIPTTPDIYAIYNKGYAFTIGNEQSHDYCGVLNNRRNCMAYEIEVIGSIYDNPELIKAA